MRFAVLLAAALCTGCMPVVQHGPWVHRGYSGSLGASGGASTELDGPATIQPFFSFEGGMRVGITPADSSHEGASIGVQLPLLSVLAALDASEDAPFAFLQFLQLEGYVTAPRVGGLHTAAGLTASNFHYMPYVQAGRYDDWYSTVALMVARDPDFMMIAPSYTTVARSSPGTLRHVTLTAGVGTTGDETLFMAGFTLIFEFHRVRP